MINGQTDNAAVGSLCGTIKPKRVYNFIKINNLGQFYTWFSRIIEGCFSTTGLKSVGIVHFSKPSTNSGNPRKFFIIKELLVF